MRPLEYLSCSILDFLYPEKCAQCGVEHQEGHWCPVGPMVDGLRAWDRPHLCRGCLVELSGESVTSKLSFGEGGELKVLAAARTGEDLVRLVGAWKYHGLRGLAWPLASWLAQALEEKFGFKEGNIGLVPVPLHRARRRSRGFNQAEVLVNLLAEEKRFKILGDILKRTRPTGQQAKVAGSGARSRNLQNAFYCGTPAPPTGAPGLYLVDDLVTSGATVLSAAETLTRSGWEVTGVIALGVAAHYSEVKVEAEEAMDEEATG
ncbi:MAG: hypothetical protein KOO60_06585 [Gemmatimonadales bacterium]|nr:hypothetical protein [Gemmatimonadales bacterium]